ncbi:MAG: hypothetical protein IPN60_04325 [Saprospiraceae bacterium]|nr:hypothetical protein [Candidatus Opimibacter skivensis]
MGNAGRLVNGWFVIPVYLINLVKMCLLPLNTGLALPLIMVFTLCSITNLSSNSLLKAGFVSPGTSAVPIVLASVLAGIVLPAAFKVAPTKVPEGFTAGIVLKLAAKKLTGFDLFAFYGMKF